jgi:Transposase
MSDLLCAVAGQPLLVAFLGDRDVGAVPVTSNGLTEAFNGRLEHLRGSALGFRNLTNYIARSLLETGEFRNGLHPRSR